MEKKLKVLVGTPCYDGKLDVYFVDSLLNTLSISEERNVGIYPLFVCYDSLVQRARNDIFKVAYESKMDMVIFIDSDVGWKPEDFYKLVFSNKDLIGGSYRKKTDDSEIYVIKALEEIDKTLNLNVDNDGLLQVAGLGCGFLKLSRNCIETMWNVSKEYTSDKGVSKMVFEVACEDNSIISEDIYFCKKWIGLGNSVYLDTHITCVHSGTKLFKGDINNWINNWINMSKSPINIESSISMPKDKLSEYFKTKSDTDEEFKVLV